MTQAKDLGYTVKVIIVHSSVDLCMKRVSSRNAQLEQAGHAIRVIYPTFVRSMHKTFIEKDTARYYATHPSVVSKTDELYCIDNNGAAPIVLAHKTAEGVSVSRESPMANVPGAFYGLTIRSDDADAGAGAAGSSGSISGGKSRRRQHYTARKNKNTLRRRTQRYRRGYL